MSADSWDTCPYCGGAWREDYCFSGADTGIVDVDYRGVCRGYDRRSGCGAELYIREGYDVPRPACRNCGIVGDHTPKCYASQRSDAAPSGDSASALQRLLDAQ